MNVSGKSIHIPDNTQPDEAFERTTHLAIGAHQDDLEVFAFHGIATCYDREDKWFGGVTVTDGASSARAGKFKDVSNEEMVRIRAGEQDRAADIGQYAFQVQMGFSSSDVRNREKADVIVNELLDVLTRASPEVVYLHNPADKHDTHIAVLGHCLEAIRRMPGDSRPAAVYGCEVWRDLDWLDDDRKVVLRADQDVDLAKRLIDVFESQIAGGKNYTASTLGRRMANATFFDPRKIDTTSACTFALDLTPLVKDDSMSLSEFTLDHVQQFKDDVASRLKRLAP